MPVTAQRLCPAPVPAGRCNVKRRDIAAHASAVQATVDGTLSTKLVPVQGAELEVISTPERKEQPPLLFLHGSGHAAWCWAERFMPWLAQKGLECHALSFRGHGNSPVPQDAGKAAGTLASNAEDVAAVVATLRSAPVPVGHSFGGLIMQKHLAQAARQQGSGTAGMPVGNVFLCSSPPTAIDVGRYMRNAPLLSTKATWALISKNYLRNPKALRDVFFHAGTPQQELEQLQLRFAANASPLSLVDLSRLRKEELPVDTVPDAHVKPTLVLGAAQDALVDEVDCDKVASRFHTKANIIQGSGHDAMLDIQRQTFAEKIHAFVMSL